MSPIYLHSNQPPARFYQGGARIRSFRQESAAAALGDRVPEDWVGSTTTIFNESHLGRTTLADGKVLKDAIEADPLYWLGAEHVAKFGPDVKLLVKLLDAGQRLPVHIHPDHSFAKQHLQRRHGKAEAWYIMDGGVVYLGFSRDISDSELQSWVAGQNVEDMLGAMHAIAVESGDSVYVPPGLPHAIGSGVFLVEVQEPEDLSILLEWQGFAIDGVNEGHLGLGFETALRATDRRGYSEAKVNELIVRQGVGTSTLAQGSESYFRAESYTVDKELQLEAGFCVLVATDGQGSMRLPAGREFPVIKGDTLMVAHNEGSFVLEGALSIVCCRPPV